MSSNMMGVFLRGKQAQGEDHCVTTDTDGSDASTRQAKPETGNTGS